MSNVAHRASAPAPSDSNFEGLTKRLLALRAEIDAILAELPSQALAVPLNEAAAPVLLSPLTDDAPIHQDNGITGDEKTALEPIVGGKADELLEPSEVAQVTMPEQPVADAAAVMEPIELAGEASPHATQDLDASTPAAATNTDLVEPVDSTSQSLDEPKSPTPEIPVVSAAQPADAAIIDRPQQEPVESTQREQALPEAVALVGTNISAIDGALTNSSSAALATGAGEARAEAAVISLHTRQRKQKGELATRAPGPVRSSRHVVAKIAACILVLFTAATILVVADRTAMGGVQSFPWMSPTSSNPAAADQDTLADQPGSAPIPDDRAEAADLPALADGILMWYRGTWPSGS
jgi:hypothetical protein